MTLSEKLLALRKKSGMSQEELAAKAGVSRQSVSRWEMGTALPDAQNLLELSRIFRVSADFLLRDEIDFSCAQDKHAEAPKAQTPKTALFQKTPLLYEILCNLPLLLLCIASDISLAAMTVCFLSVLLVNFSRVFTAKPVPFSRLEKSMRQRILLSYILSSAFMLVCAVTVYFAAPATAASNRTLLLVFFVQIYIIVHAETFIYFPGDRSPVLHSFRRKFYSFCPCFSAFPVAALAARFSVLSGGSEALVLSITLAVLLALCAVAALILKRKEERENAD